MMQALAAEGFASCDGAPWARVVRACEATYKEVAREVSWVVEGGILGIYGGDGPLLAALNLTPGEKPAEEPVRPAATGVPQIPLAGAWPVTGVGYSLYRSGDLCVALAGPRGKGWVAYVATAEPRLLAACLSWIRGRVAPA